MSGASAELGRLLIRLGFNANTVRDGLIAINNMLNNTGDHAQRTGNQLHGAGTRGAAGFSMLTRAALGFTAVATAGMAVRHFVKSIAEASKDMENISKNLGISASTISATGNATELAGGTKEGLQQVLKMLAVENEKYKLTGESGLLQFFNFLGISLGQNISAMEYFLQMRDKLLERTGGDRTKAFTIGQMMGLDEGTMNLLLKPDAEFRALMAQGKATGMSDAESKSAERITRSFTLLEQKFESLGRVIMTQLEPAILSFNKWLGQAVDWIENKLSGKGLMQTAKDAVLWTNPVTALYKLISNDLETQMAGGQSLIPWDMINSMRDKLMGTEFFRGTWDEFLQQNRGKDPGTIGGDFLDRFISPSYQLTPGGNSQTNNNTSTETHVGEIKIYTQTQDQAGEIASKLNYMFAANSNSAVV